jgi:hypothetical protein
MERSMPARYDQGAWRDRLRRGNRASEANLEGAAASVSELSDVTSLRGAE